MPCADLNLPALSESDPGKPIKASWGDRVVQAISDNCDSIQGFGKANSVFDVFAGDGSLGDLDVVGPTSLNVPSVGMQFENLTIRAGQILTLIRTAPFLTPVDSFGIYKIGVSGKLRLEASAILTAAGRGRFGGAGGIGAPPFTNNATAGTTGQSNFRYGLGQGGSGAGGGGGAGAFAGLNGAGGGYGGWMLGHLWNYPPGAAGGIGGVSIGQAGLAGQPIQVSTLRSGMDLDVMAAGIGGSGGGGGGAGFNPFQFGSGGGAGGNGGGTIILEVNELEVFLPAPTIIANANNGVGGTAGAAGGGAGGGGSGGAGGVIFLCYRESLPSGPNFPATSVNGGLGGPGGAPGLAAFSQGGNGGNSSVGFVQFRQV